MFDEWEERPERGKFQRDQEDRPQKPKRVVKVDCERRLKGELIRYERAVVLQERIRLPDTSIPAEQRGNRKVEYAKLRLRDGSVVLVPSSEIVGWHPV